MVVSIFAFFKSKVYLFFTSNLETLCNTKLLHNQTTKFNTTAHKKANEHSLVQNTIDSDFYALASIACSKKDFQ